MDFSKMSNRDKREFEAWAQTYQVNLWKIIFGKLIY
jgi:hypothetical protein